VFFFDTPDLALDKHGVVVRARRVQNKGDDTVVKLRPIHPDDLPPKIRKSPSFGVEVDAMPGGFVCSGSLKGIAETDVRTTLLEQRPLRKLFSKEQRAFYAQHAPEGVALDDLAVLGPIFVLKVKWAPEGLDRRMVAEMWFYPDASRILELSTKCAPGEAFQVAAESRAFLSSKGVDLSGAQPVLLRPGQVSAAALEAALGCPIAARREDSPRHSGGLERHYAPKTPAKMVQVHELDREIARLKEKVAVLAFSRPDERVDFWLRMPREPAAYAHKLYAALRELDGAHCEMILIEAPPETPEWAGVRDRLLRATS
jgi:hypothetical protein